VLLPSFKDVTTTDRRRNRWGSCTRRWESTALEISNQFCAFDVDRRKTGVDIGTAISADPNCTEKFAEVPDDIDAPVYRGPSFDGIAEHTQHRDISKRIATVDDESAVDVAAKLEEHDVDVLPFVISPVGAREAVQHYAVAAPKRKSPSSMRFPSSSPQIPRGLTASESAGVPVVGDDIKSQLGATITHRNLVQLFEDRGVKLENTYQLNIGGNTDFEYA